MRKKIKILLIAGIILILVRIALPFIVLHFANRELAAMDGYYGEVQDIDIALIRGAYILDSLYINKIDSASREQTPFMAAGKIDLSVEWKALLRGRIVGELEFVNPYLNFIVDRTEFFEVQKDTADFREILNSFMPLQINRFDITNGRLIYIDSTTQPLVHVQMDQIQVSALNLKSVRDSSLLPASVRGTAHLYNGVMSMNMKLDPLAEKPLFDLNVSVEHTSLPKLNDFFKAYAKIDMNRGDFSMYTEIASKEGNFIGYVKPMIRELDVRGPEDREDDFMNKVWENIVAAFGEILENPKADQVATKIPLEGTFEQANPDIWTSLVELLRNAFVRALYPAIEQQINLASLNEAEEKKKGFFSKIFGNEEKEEQKQQKAAGSN